MLNSGKQCESNDWHILLSHWAASFPVSCTDVAKWSTCCCCCCHDEPVRCCLYGGTDVPKRWEIPPDSHSPGTHLWCQSNHQSNAGILVPILGKVVVNVQPSRPDYHNVDRLDWGFNLATKCRVGSREAESIELQLVDCSSCLSWNSTITKWSTAAH